MSESNGKPGASASETSQQPLPKNMSELKAKWMESVRELNEKAAAAAAAHATTPPQVRVKPKVSASASERLPKVNLDEISASGKKRTSLMGTSSLKFNASGGPDPPKPPPSPFEPYAFADFSVPMAKVVQEVERTSNTGKGTPPRSQVLNKIVEKPQEATLVKASNKSERASPTQATPSFSKNSDGGKPDSTTDPSKVVISIPSPAKAPPLSPVPEAQKKPSAPSFCLCFRPQVSELGSPK